MQRAISGTRDIPLTCSPARQKTRKRLENGLRVQPAPCIVARHPNGTPSIRQPHQCGLSGGVVSSPRLAVFLAKGQLEACRWTPNCGGGVDPALPPTGAGKVHVCDKAIALKSYNRVPKLPGFLMGNLLEKASAALVAPIDLTENPGGRTGKGELAREGLGMLGSLQAQIRFLPDDLSDRFARPPFRIHAGREYATAARLIIFEGARATVGAVPGSSVRVHERLVPPLMAKARRTWNLHVPFCILLRSTTDDEG